MHGSFGRTIHMITTNHVLLVSEVAAGASQLVHHHHLPPAPDIEPVTAAIAICAIALPPLPEDCVTGGAATRHGAGVLVLVDAGRRCCGLAAGVENPNECPFI